MGRALKKRNLKKTKRVKVSRPSAGKPKKGGMKKWEWWLIGAAFTFAVVWVIILGLKGMTVIHDINDAVTPTVVETPVNP